MRTPAHRRILANDIARLLLDDKLLQQEVDKLIEAAGLTRHLPVMDSTESITNTLRESK